MNNALRHLLVQRQWSFVCNSSLIPIPIPPPPPPPRLLFLFRYDFYREDFPLREQIIGSKYAGPLLAQSLVSSRKSHFNLKFVSQLVLKVRSSLSLHVFPCLLLRERLFRGGHASLNFLSVAGANVRVCVWMYDDSHQEELRRALPDSRRCIAKFSETRALSSKAAAREVAAGGTKRRTRRRLWWYTRHRQCTTSILMVRQRG